MAKLIVGLNDLATVNLDLAAEWHPTKNGSLLPSQVTAGSSKKVWWLGKCGHEWEAGVSSRNKGIGCPYCSGHRAIAVVQSVQVSTQHRFPSRQSFITSDNTLTRTPNRVSRSRWMARKRSWMSGFHP